AKYQERCRFLGHMKFNSLFRCFVASLALAATATLFPASLALAGKDDHVEARRLLQKGEILPLTQILEVAQARVTGDVIEVELEQEDQGWEYKVKVLTPTGLVRKITLNARNGVVIKIKDD
ncbi:MAG: PepSY domain-containing protein, partial [Pseudoxanthomonas sp.]